jgi:hypothetical protein
MNSTLFTDAMTLTPSGDGVYDGELRQGVRTGDERSREEQKVAVRAAVTLGDPEHHVPPLLSVNPVVPLMMPEPPPGLEPIGPGHPMEDVVHWPTAATSGRR